jgi:para-nitrobenzyl esterase
MSENKKTVVRTRDGKVKGSYQEGLYIFKGIPYVAPPVGERRWLPPQPVEPWQGVRQAQTFGATSPQNWSPLNDIIPDFGVVEPRSEDCLYLNVWSPGLDDARRPVLVWIHGGAFNLGSGSQSPYDASKLARRGDAVVVTFSYRLGVFGFLRLNEVTGGKVPATGNEGLLDQIAALNWVRDNIAAFGGDPDNVTVFGESAGGMSIECLLAMAPARGLFHKSIIQSSLGEIPGTPLSTAVKVAEQLLGTLGLSPGDVGAMRSLTPEQLLSADVELRTRMAGPGEGQVMTITTPVMDGKTIPEVPVEAIKGGCADSIPVLIGSTLDEFRLFGMISPDFAKMSEAEMVKRCQMFIPAERVSGLIETYRKARAVRGADTSPAGIFAAIQTDFMFRMPAIHFIEAQQRYAPTYNYLFTWESPVRGGIFGACHALDIGFVFGTHNDSFWGSGPAADKLSAKMQDVWLAFARTGNPSCESLGKWPDYGNRRVAMLLGEDCHLEEAAYDEERRAWELMPEVFGR